MNPISSLLFLLLTCASGTVENVGSKGKDRYVLGQQLISRVDPEVTIKFSDDFIFAGSEQFTLFNVSEVEQFHFVRSYSHRNIQSLITVQFEKYLPNVPYTFDYNIPDTVIITGLPWMHSPVYNKPSRVFERAQQTDVWHKFQFLKSKGFVLPTEVTGHRFIRLLDADRKKEILIIYNEAVMENPGSPAKSPQPSLKDALSGFTISTQH